VEYAPEEDSLPFDGEAPMEAIPEDIPETSADGEQLAFFKRGVRWLRTRHKNHRPGKED